MRKTGATAGGWDTYITGPPETNFKRFRSKQDIRRYFELIGETRLRWEDFDFNPFGSKGQHDLLLRMRGEAEASSSASLKTLARIKQDSGDVEVKPDAIFCQEESKPDLGLFLECEILHE